MVCIASVSSCPFVWVHAHPISWTQKTQSGNKRCFYHVTSLFKCWWNEHQDFLKHIGILKSCQLIFRLLVRIITQQSLSLSSQTPHNILLLVQLEQLDKGETTNSKPHNEGTPKAKLQWKIWNNIGNVERKFSRSCVNLETTRGGGEIGENLETGGTFSFV